MASHFLRAGTLSRWGAASNILPVSLLSTAHLEASLWDQRVDALGLRVEASPIFALVEQVHAELAAAGIAFRPAYCVSNEWGCPDLVPLVGIPFFLVDPRFHAVEEEHADDLEDAARILAGIRHEVGHALNYAFRLYLEVEWTGVFGDFFADYDDDYRPLPFAAGYVRHLPGWYSQKHPDEDFAETFALWLTPGSNWRERYATQPRALAKLEYVDRAMRRVGTLAPEVDPAQADADPDELAFTVREYYTTRATEDAGPVDELGPWLDDDLRGIFSADGIGTDAEGILLARRRTIMNSVSTFTGARLYVVKALIDAVGARLHTLGLRALPGREIDAVTEVTALVAALVANFVQTGHFRHTSA